jgi:hypothetical protein
LLISEQTPLFGYMESGYRQAIVVSIVLEVAATLLLGTFLAGLLRPARERRRAEANPRSLDQRRLPPGRRMAAPVGHRQAP